MNDAAPHLVVLTRSWEFHVLDGICVAARNRQTGAPIEFHEARGGQVLGSAWLDDHSGRWQLAPGLRLGELLAVDGSRGRFHSEPILAIESHSRAEGRRLLARIRSTPPPPKPADRRERVGLLQLWERMVMPPGDLHPSGAGA